MNCQSGIPGIAGSAVPGQPQRDSRARAEVYPSQCPELREAFLEHLRKLADLAKSAELARVARVRRELEERLERSELERRALDLLEQRAVPRLAR